MRSIPLGRKPVQMNFDDLLSTKVCWDCGKEKTLSEFHTSRSRKAKDGRAGQCAECNRASARERYYKNRERRIAYAKEYAERNREKTKEYKRLHYKAKRGKYAKWGREYYQTNRERIRARDAVYNEAHREEAKVRAKRYERNLQKFRPDHYKALSLKRSQNRRARMAQAEGIISAEEWNALKAKYDHRCLRCGAQEPDCKLTLDHVIPISKGGSNTVDNAQPLCHPCNSGKGAKHVDYRPK